MPAFDKKQMDAMVNRFLGWKLPRTFSPDAGIKFTPSNGMSREEAYAKPGWWPIGTNLLTADEARAMLEHVTAVEVHELSLRELDAIGHAYFNGPLNANEEMFGRAVERAVRQRLLGAAATTKQEEGETLPGVLCPNGGYCDYPSNPCFTCRRPRPSNPSGDGSQP